jgi:hypothetical protein
VVDRFCTTLSGLEVVVVVVVSDDDEGGGVTTGAGGRRCAIFDCGGGFPGGGRSAYRANTDGQRANRDGRPRFPILHFSYSPKNSMNERAVEVLYREGTFAPDLRASDRPIAIACLRLFTFLPDFPDLSLPRFISCIARPTLEEAFLLYFRDLLFVAIVTNRNRGCLTRSFIKRSAAKAISLVVFSPINEIMTASRLNLTI